MRPACLLAALALLSACVTAGPEQHDRPQVQKAPPRLLNRIGSLLPDRRTGDNCALTVYRGHDLLMYQHEPGTAASVQRADGRHVLVIKKADGDLFGPYASDQLFADETLSIHLVLNPAKSMGQTSGVLTIRSSAGLTAILPVSASLACYR